MIGTRSAEEEVEEEIRALEERQANGGSIRMRRQVLRPAREMGRALRSFAARIDSLAAAHSPARRRNRRARLPL
jgi:hypothetical protein